MIRNLWRRLLDRFCIQTIRIPQEGKWLLLVQGKTNPKNLASLRQHLEWLADQEDGAILIWSFGEKAKKVKFIKIGR